MIATGDWPSSEASYLAHSDLIDVALPGHGGNLQSDGTWLQSDAKLDNAWAQALPGLAATAGQRYVPVLDPGHGTDHTELKAVLDDTDLWVVAADDALQLATTRFDAPWDGIMYDICFIDAEYIDLHGQFVTYLSGRVRSAGLSFEIAHPAVRNEDEAYWISLDVLAELADAFDYYVYGWDESTQPHWYAVDSMDNAMSHGCENVMLGIGLFARHWTDPETSTDISYDAAMDLIGDGAIQWVESDDTGLVREKYAGVDDGYIWLQDGDTIKPRLALADQYGLEGVMLFRPGMGAESVWRAVEGWKYPRPAERRRTSRRARTTNWREHVR